MAEMSKRSVLRIWIIISGMTFRNWRMREGVKSGLGGRPVIKWDRQTGRQDEVGKL